MHSRTRTLVILAGATGAAVLVAALGRVPLGSAPDIGPSAAGSAAERPDVQPERRVELAPLAVSEVAAAASDIERTEVAVSPKAGTVQTGDEERVRLRAALLAKNLGLSAADEESLTVVLLDEQARRGDALTQLRRNPDEPGIRAQVRTELDAIRAWKATALNDRFGAEVAAAIMKR